MFILIAAGLCALVLFVLYRFAPVMNSKTLLMSTIVMVMLILTVIDELVLPNYPSQPAQHFQFKVLPNNLMLNFSSDLYRNSPSRTLLKQQRILLTYLLQKEAQKQNFVIHIQNIDSSRFRAIFKQFQTQTKVPAVHVDYSQHDYTFSDFESALTDGKGIYSKYSNKIVYLFVENINSFDATTALENIFLNYNVSYILQKIPSVLLEMSLLGKWTYRYQFEGNYLEKVLENHPPRLVELCSKYRVIDYSFYVMSLSQPLSELCTQLPTNSVTECIRQYMRSFDDKVAYSKVRKCFDGKQLQNIDGVIQENGMVSLVKDYYYAGKVSKSMFSLENEPSETL